MVVPAGFQRYGTPEQNTGVLAYELHDDGIHLIFRDSPDIYVYDDGHTGPQHVAAMKRFAVSGRGLSTYVSQHVQHRYAYKHRPATDPSS